MTLRQIVRGYAETRQYERAIASSHRLVQADPLREASYHNLMRLYLAVGRPEEALHDTARREQHGVEAPGAHELGKHVDARPGSGDG